MCGRGERRTSRRRPPGRRSDGETGHRPPAGGRSRRKYRGLRGYLPLRVRHRAPVARVGGAIPRDDGAVRERLRGLLRRHRRQISTRHRACRGFRRAFEIGSGTGPHSHAARLAGALLGQLLYETGDLATAMRLLDESYRLGPEGGGVDYLAARYVIGARLRPIHGDRDSAVERLSAGMKVAEQPGLQRLAAGVNNERIRLGIESAAAVNRLRAERTIPPTTEPPG